MSATSRIGDALDWGRVLTALTASMLVAAGGQARAGACDSLKSTLAERIESTGVRGYSLEGVPARTPVPPGAKVIGTCEGGATKMLYRRWAVARAASSADADEAKPAPAAQNVAMPSKPAAPPMRPPVPAPAPARAVAPAPAPESARAPVPVPVPAPALALAPAPAPAPQPVAVSQAAAVAMADQPVAVTEPVRLARPVEPTVPLPARISEFTARNWPWMAALLLLPLLGWLWAWLAYRRDYDDAGLPRGPRL